MMDLSDPQAGELAHEFWRGTFGDEYHARQTVTAEANESLFRRALAFTHDIKSVAEIGAGTGLNLHAIRTILPYAFLAGIEINAGAAAQMRAHPDIKVEEMRAQDWYPAECYDMTMTRGLLIHIPPPDLPAVYAALVRGSRRYVLICEYFSTKLQEVEYRGNLGKLWKGPHAYDMMDRYPNLRLIDYGFQSSRDLLPQDDINWWLLEKQV